MDSHPDTPHRRAWDAIPWVVAGSADEHDTRLVHEHLPHCADCQAEWQLQMQVRAGLEASVPTHWPAPDAPWARLMHRLDDEAGAPAHTSPAQAAAPSANTSRWLVAAVLVQAVALGASGLAWWQSGSADYRTLTSAPSGAAATQLRVVPAPELDVASLQALLAQNGLVIVEIAADGRHLGLAAADGRTATARAALPALRAHPGLRLAEATAAAAER